MSKDAAVGIEKSPVKGELYAVTVEGKRIGNFRKTDKGYRQGMGSSAVFHSLELTVEDVANIIAQAHITEHAARAEAKAQAKAAAAEAKAEKAATDGEKKPVRKGRSRKAKVNEDALIAEAEAEMEAAL